MKHKNMNCQKEYRSNRNCTVHLKNDWNMIPEHTEKSADKRNKDNRQQQPALKI